MGVFDINPRFTKTYHNDTYPSISPSRPELSAEGKVVLVTGGGKGIGKGIATAFADAHASALILGGRTESALIETKSELQASHPNVRVFTYILDCSNAASVDEVFKSIERDVGAIDILVNNAGYLPDYSPVRDTVIDEWWSGFEVNLLGYFHVARAFLQSLHHTRKGTIINISSVAAHLRFNNMSSYSTSKNAALWLTDCIVEEEDNVFAVNVHPGVVATDMNKKNNGIPEDDIKLPAHTAVWLASEEATFLRGRTIWSNWDVDEIIAQKDKILEQDLLRMTLRGYPISRGLGYKAES